MKQESHSQEPHSFKFLCGFLPIVIRLHLKKHNIEVKFVDFFIHGKVFNLSEMPFDPTFLLSCTVSNVICSIVFGNRYDYEDKKFLALLDKMDDNIHLLNSQWGQVLVAVWPLGLSIDK